MYVQRAVADRLIADLEGTGRAYNGSHAYAAAAEMFHVVHR